MAESFTTSLTVDKNIVEILSRSTYQRNFSYALREMVSNAYDADATRVSITVDRKNNSLTIHDNGNGMTRDEFSYYLRIAGKKRGKLITARFRRKRIGQFGVGFLAVFPFCQTLTVTTTTENSDQILTANIPAADFFAKPFAEFDVESVEVRGTIRSEPRRAQDHFTTITLTGLTQLAKESISTVRPKHQAQKRRRTASIWDASPLERLAWELSDELPLAFPEGSAYREVFRPPESQVMDVEFDGTTLYRNDVMGDLLDKGDFSVAGVKCKYAICTPWKAIKPWEMRNVKMRLNNVGVGPRTEFDITRTRGYSRLSWLSGELHILEGLDDLLSVSRDAFVESEAYNAVHERMAAILGKQALFIESIEESSIAISKQLIGGKQVSVAAKRDVIEKGVKKLVEKGFSVERVKPKGRSDEAAVRVDRKKRIVTVIEDHPSFRDEISVGGKDYALEFRSLSATLPCRFEGKDVIVVNTDFRLFHSRRYGELFKRFCIISLVASQARRSPSAMLDFILREMKTQFAHYA